MKKNFLKGLACIFFASTVLISCEDSNSDIDLDTNDLIDPEIKDKEDTKPKISYAVPTPNELFEIVKLLGGELNIELMNSLDNKDSYVDLKSKALNFGVYSADLGYMSCFENGIEFLKYTKAIESIGEELGISEVFDQDLMDRIADNEDDFDALFTISNETYYDSYLYLEENEKGQELSLIIIGGYIESLYIITNLVNEYSDNNPIIEKIGDQNLVLENIIDFCTQYADEAAVSEALSDLMALKSIFDENMEFVDGKSEDTTIDENGVTTFSTSGGYEMNEKTFDIVKTEITNLRNNITQK